MLMLEQAVKKKPTAIKGIVIRCRNAEPSNQC